MPADTDQARDEEPAAAGRREMLVGEPLFSFDAELRILAWYRAAEELTGLRAEQAVGRRCWQILDGVDEDGTPVCKLSCAAVQRAQERWCVAEPELHVRTPRGLRPVSLATVRVRGGDQPVFLHLLRRRPVSRAERPPAPRDSEAALTGRQREVLQLLAEGVRAHEIAVRFGLSETTVRNHIRALLARLGCHSQLEAVAKARRLGLIESPAAELSA